MDHRKPLRERLSDLWWDVRHPITTLLREAALRYCTVNDMELIPRRGGPVEIRLRGVSQN